MRLSARITIFVALALSLALHVSAFDQNDYKAYAEELRRSVWEQDLPEFQNVKTTDRFSDHSAVILAAYDEYSVTHKNKFNLFSVNGLSQELNSYSLWREMVQLNDETALKAYSEYDFMAYASRRSFYYGKFEMRNVLGVRVIKPDGTIHEISTDDYVMIAEGKKGKDERQKLAVPGLEVGDIIDVFISSYTKTKDVDPTPRTFCFVADYPMLSYRVHCELDRDLAAQYRTFNGAPDFKVSMLADHYALNVKVENVEATEPSLWYNRHAQTPLTVLAIHLNAHAPGTKGMTMRTQGLQANPDATAMLHDDWETWDTSQRFFALGKKEKEAVKEAVTKFDDQEQRADYLYEFYEAYELSNKLGGSKPTYFICRLRECFKKAGISYQCGITTSTENEPIDELINSDNTVWFLRLPESGKCYFAPTFACRPGEVPAELQGRKAVVCTNEKQKKLMNGPFEQLVLPMNEAKDNCLEHTIEVDIEGDLLNFHRTTSFSGAQRRNISLYLPTRAELVNSIMEKHNPWKDRKSLYEEKYWPLLSEQDAEDQENQRSFVMAVAMAIHDEKPAELKDYKVLTVGTTAEKPCLSYEQNYTMAGMVKRAGKSMVLSAGKLLGSQLKIEGKDRERTADVIREIPALLVWNITVRLPEGYTVAEESLDALRVSLTNVAGSFSVEPKLADGKLLLKAQKTVLGNRIPVAEWPQVLELYDKVYEYRSRQVVLKTVE